MKTALQCSLLSCDTSAVESIKRWNLVCQNERWWVFINEPCVFMSGQCSSYLLLTSANCHFTLAVFCCRMNSICIAFCTNRVEFTQLAADYKAVNLGQGFPDFSPPQFVQDAFCKAVSGGPAMHQYTRAFVSANIHQGMCFSSFKCQIKDALSVILVILLIVLCRADSESRPLFLVMFFLSPGPSPPCKKSGQIFQ